MQQHLYVFVSGAPTRSWCAVARAAACAANSGSGHGRPGTD